MFTKRLRELRIERDLTQRELAARLGISQSSIANYELGEREPDQNTLCLIADFFKVSTDYLLGRSQYQTWQLFEEEVENVDIEDLIINHSNIYLMGELLDKNAKNDVILFLKTAQEFLKRQAKSH